MIQGALNHGSGATLARTVRSAPFNNRGFPSKLSARAGARKEAEIGVDPTRRSQRPADRRKSGPCQNPHCRALPGLAGSIRPRPPRRPGEIQPRNRPRPTGVPPLDRSPHLVARHLRLCGQTEGDRSAGSLHSKVFGVRAT